MRVIAMSVKKDLAFLVARHSGPPSLHSTLARGAAPLTRATGKREPRAELVGRDHRNGRRRPRADRAGLSRRGARALRHQVGRNTKYPVRSPTRQVQCDLFRGLQRRRQPERHSKVSSQATEALMPSRCRALVSFFEYHLMLRLGSKKPIPGHRFSNSSTSSCGQRPMKTSFSENFRSLFTFGYRHSRSHRKSTIPWGGVMTPGACSFCPKTATSGNT